MRAVFKKRKNKRKEKWPRQGPCLFPYAGCIGKHFTFEAYTKILFKDV